MNVPQLRFSGFDGEWEKTELGKITNTFSGGTPDSKNPNYYSGTIPFIRSGEINSSSTALFINEAGLKNSSAKMVCKGDLLIALYGATSGEIGVSKIDGAINQAVLCLRTEHSKVFLMNMWKKHKENIILTYLQGGQGNLSGSIVKNVEFYLPKKEEQEKIAKFFSILDRKIEKQQEKIEKLEQFKKGMMQKIFSQELRFRDEDGGEFREWETKQLKEFATKTVKKNKDMKVTNVISNSAKQGLISQRSYFKKDIANVLNIDGYYVISKGDFVYNPRISSESPYGPVHVYELEDDGIVSPLYLCFKTKNIDSKFLKYFFMSSQWHKYIYTHGDSGARHDRVSIKDSAFFEMKIAMPSLAEQEKISGYLTSLNLKVEKEKEKLMLIEEQKNGVMWGMFV